MLRSKGMRDLLPEDMARFRLIEDTFRRCCSQYGYQEVRTPTLEYLHFFTTTGTLTSKMQSRVYTFLDWDGWSGERVVLRPDGTIPIARLYVDNFMGYRDVTRLFYVENIFRFVEAKEGNRERWQCGAELMGSALPQADAEIIYLAVDVLEKMGLENLQVRLSHAGIIKAILAEAHLAPQKQREFFDLLQDGDAEVFARLMSEVPWKQKPMEALWSLEGRSPGFLRNLRVLLAGQSPGVLTGLDNLIAITDALTSLPCDYQISLALAGGFEYYTGVMFHIYASGEKVGGGGRYDELIPLIGGGAIPSSGFALYVDKLMDLLPATGIPRTPEQILVRAQGEDQWPTTFELAHRLREQGHVAEIDLGHQKPVDFRWVISVIPGEQEICYLLEDRATGQQTRMTSGEWEKLIKSIE